MPSFAGRHELGQNFLTHAPTALTIARLASRGPGPIVEIGAGTGFLTRRLEALGRPVTAIEIDPGTAARLEASAAANTTVVCADALDHTYPTAPFTLVGNLPFHLTTALLRMVLATPAWTDAVLLVQWEVARRRAGVGGASQLTAQWWPWYDFALIDRVPAHHFRPRPQVDGGILHIERRDPGRLPRREYQAMVAAVFGGRGRGLPDILRRSGRFDSARLDAWLRARRVGPRALPKDLGRDDWLALWECRAGGPPGRPQRGGRRPGR